MQAIASQEIRTPENWCEMIKAALTACGAERGSVCGRDGGAGVGCGR